jgi:cytochrome c553
MRNNTIKGLAIGLVTAVAVGAVASPAQAAGDPAAGRQRVATCTACHGQNGKATTPIYPNLAGQNEQYLVSALKAYKTGDRKNPIMKPMAAPLSDADIENIAAFYASQKACP